MVDFIKRCFNRLCKSLFLLYAPQILILFFAIVFFKMFPDGPLWPVGVFVVFIVFVFARYLK